MKLESAIPWIRALSDLSVWNTSSSERRETKKKFYVRFSVALWLLACGDAALALTVSPTNPLDGNYTVTTDVQLGCETFYWPEWGAQSTQCNELQEQNNGNGEFGGEGWRAVPASGYSVSFTNRALGTYQYRVFTYWYGTVEPGSYIMRGPISQLVGDPNGPKPQLFATLNPFTATYLLTWQATGPVSANSCKLYRYRSTNIFSGPPTWQRIPGWFPTSGTRDIGRQAGWRVQCTGPGGTTTVSGN
jgi:hypothetical protein